jgi:carboxylesterase
MNSYPERIASIAQTTAAIEDQLPVLNQNCRSRFLLHPEASDRVCLFLHGFTAGPYQFIPLGETFFAAGYNVLIPRLPGHGQAGSWGKGTPPPLPTDAEVYLEFALHWFEQAQQLGQEVIVGGLSAGGTLAAWLGLEKSKAIYRSLLFAPYLSSRNRLVDLMVKNSGTYFAWDSPTATDAKATKGGYHGFALPALRVFLELGSNLLHRAKSQPAAPMFILPSESDIAVSVDDHCALFQSVLAHQPIAWHHCFDRSLGIPHTMMTDDEGNRWHNLLMVMAKAFVESCLTWSEVEEIATRMTDGRTFDHVVAELNLQSKASPDMPAMMTMIDKRAILEQRDLSLSEL